MDIKHFQGNYAMFDLFDIFDSTPAPAPRRQLTDEERKQQTDRMILSIEDPQAAFRQGVRERGGAF